MSLRAAPDHLIEIKRYGWCVPCSQERNMKIRGPKVELTREGPTGDPLPLPSERQRKDGAKRQPR